MEGLEDVTASRFEGSCTTYYTAIMIEGNDLACFAGSGSVGQTQQRGNTMFLTLDFCRVCVEEVSSSTDEFCAL